LPTKVGRAAKQGLPSNIARAEKIKINQVYTNNYFLRIFKIRIKKKK
jgi:hypothetical protein